MSGLTKLQIEYTDVICLSDPKRMRREASTRLPPLLEGISSDEFLNSIEAIHDLTALRHAITDLVLRHKVCSLGH